MPAFSVSLPATIEEDGPVASWPNGQATGVFAGSTRVLTAELGLARLDSVAGGQPGRPRWSSRNRTLPESISRTTSIAQRWHSTSAAFETGQNWP